MVNKRQRKPWWPIALTFIIINSLLLVAKRWATELKLDTDILIIGNIVLFLATIISFILYQRSLSHSNPQAFLRYIYSGMFLKMLICIIAAFIYIASVNNVNKPAIFGCMFLYFIYTFIEVSILLRLSKQDKNVQTGSPS
jgi:uncharacterized YccA/Bax inhibitor family protein